MPTAYDIDLKRPETWVNHPAPFIDHTYRDQLTQLGGLNHYGEPVLRFGWGQSTRRFFAGAHRILYTDDRLEPVMEYRNGKRHAEFIGQPLWFIEKWSPMTDSLQTWEHNRFGKFDDPASGMLLPCVDLLGEYPHEGRYDAFFVVGNWYGDRDEQGQKILRYRPIGQDVVDHVKRLYRACEQAEPLNVEAHIRKRVAEQEAREHALHAEMGEKIRSDLWPHRHRFIEGDAMMSLANTKNFDKVFKETNATKSDNSAV